MRSRKFLGVAFVIAATALRLMANELTTVPADMRYGFFNCLDRRSTYGTGPYPEPFIVDDTVLEVNEARLDWLHSETPDGRDDNVKAEIEKGFGQVTLEIEAPYEFESVTTSPKSNTMGFDNIDVGARCPVYQLVSDNEFVNTTFGVAVELGIPTETPFSKDWEVVPKIFNDLQLGERFTMQSIAGLSMLYGSGDEDGAKAFEYGFVFGYSIPHAQLPLPHVLQFIPVFELSGETALNHGGSGLTSLTGNAGFRVNLKTIGPVQPRLGIGYVFP